LYKSSGDLMSRSILSFVSSPDSDYEIPPSRGIDPASGIRTNPGSYQSTLISKEKEQAWVSLGALDGTYTWYYPGKLMDFSRWHCGDQALMFQVQRSQAGHLSNSDVTGYQVYLL
jgi:hypothetical protein